MADETETTSEVARVLNLHASFKASAEIQDPNTPWYWECDGCDARLALSGTYGRPEVVAALANHQADLLAEAGVLRGDGPKRIGRSPGTLYVEIEVTPHDWATRGETFDTWYEASPEQAIAALRGEANRWAAEYGLPQIAAPVPAEQPHTASGGCGSGEGVGVASGSAYALGGQVEEAEVWKDVVSRVDAEFGRVKRERDALRAQVEAIRGQIAYEARHGDAITRCNLVAERFQAVLDGVTKPEMNENEGA